MGWGCGGSGSRRKFHGVQEKFVSFGIEAHGLGAEFGLNGFRFAEFVRRIFVEDVHEAFGGGGEDQSGFGFIGCGIDAAGNRERLDDFSGVGIEYDQLSRIAASAEEAMVLDV